MRLLAEDFCEIHWSKCCTTTFYEIIDQKVFSEFRLTFLVLLLETLILALEILISVMEMYPRARADFSEIQGEKDLFALFRCMSQKFGKNSMSGTNQGRRFKL